MNKLARPITIPEEWLADPSLIESQSKPYCESVWDVTWSMFARNGEHHPEDHAEELGDRDFGNFDYLMQLHSYWLGGRPLGKCAVFVSQRGRNRKGVNEKTLSSTLVDH